MRWLSFLRRASSQPEKKEKEVATETHGATSGLKTPENQEIPLETLQEDVPEGPKCGACYFSRRAVDAVPCEGCSLTPFFPFSKREEFYRIWKRLKLTAIKKVVANYRADQVMKKLYELMEEQDIKEKIGISNLKKAHDSLKKEVSVLKRELKGKEIDLSDTHGFEAH